MKSYSHLINESLEHFVERQRKLLSKEQEDDTLQMQEYYDNYTHKQLSSKGICLRNIECVNINTGMYGRTIIKFFVSIEHKFTIGDLAKIINLGVLNNINSNQKSSKNEISGVVSRVTSNAISLGKFQLVQAIVLHHKND